MKLKLFTETIGTSEAGISAYSFEQEISSWLNLHQQADITNVQLSCAVLDGKLQALCLVFYREME